MENDKSNSGSINLEGNVGAIGIGSTNLDFITTTGDATFILGNTNEIKTISFDFKQTEDGNFIEVVKRQEPNPNFHVAMWPSQEQKPRVWKEIYGVSSYEKGNRILLLIKTVDADVTLGHYVDESFDFDE